jgi:predicted DCC family thiol-disulfide oxidoreductase YuxK
MQLKSLGALIVRVAFGQGCVHALHRPSCANAGKQAVTAKHANMIIVFDGMCIFCNGWVRFVLNRNKAMLFKFAAAQSEAGCQLLNEVGIHTQQHLDSIVLIDGAHYFEQYDAVVRDLRQLKNHPTIGIRCSVEKCSRFRIPSIC